MNYRSFSDLGWKVSEIGLGCWQIGWCWGDVSDEDARNVLKEALDKGVNFFDTSDTYGDGRSEKFLSEIIKSNSGKIYVTTKLGRRIRGTNYSRGYKHKPMEEFIDRSLINLGVDQIDLVQLHCPPVEICSKKETFEISANIYVSKQSQKSIVIGKNGEKIKSIGIAARADLEKKFEKKIILKLWCKVQKNWVNNPISLESFGIKS